MAVKGLVTIFAACALLAPGTGWAQSKLGAGPYFNTKYRMISRGTSSTSTPDGSLTVTTDSIETINCSGCDTVYYYPGTLFNVRNNSRKPICFTFVFKPRAGAFNGVTTWGSDQVFLLRPHQTIAKFAGITMDFNMRRVDLGYDGKIQGWDPIDKRTCGPNPYV